jgi:hypothetical protein
MVSLKLLSVSALVAIFARLLTSQSLHKRKGFPRTLCLRVGSQ